MRAPLLDVLFPLRCAGCGSGPWPFCEKCRRMLVLLSPPGCMRCGLPAEHQVPGCRECPPPAIASARAAFLFAGTARAAIHRLKFSGWRAVAEALGAAMVEVCEARAEAVTWVPLSRSRLSERGFDQARLLARVVGEGLGAPVIPLLRRVGETKPQARQAASSRRAAMRERFRADRAPPSEVLLVDDVLTTGATAGACAEALLAAGAGAVQLLTAARAVSGRLPARCYTRSGSRLGLWLPGEAPR